MIGAGYRGLQEPHDAFWGARYAIIEDPDGIAVGLISPVSPEKSQPPEFVIALKSPIGGRNGRSDLAAVSGGSSAFLITNANQCAELVSEFLS